MPTKPPPKHPEVDELLLKLLEFGPMTPFRVGQNFGIGKDGALKVLSRLKSMGKIEWRGVDEAASLKERVAVKDPIPWSVPCCGKTSKGFFV